MTRVGTRRRVDAETLAALRQPRESIVLEELTSTASAAPSITAIFTAAEGPFHQYERTLKVGERGPDGLHDVAETTTFKLAVPIWSWLLTPFVWWEFRRSPRPAGEVPWWSPPDRIDNVTAASLGYLALLSIISGYLGTLLSQTLAFAGREFEVSDSAQADMASWVRLGVPIALVLGFAADRFGRRRIILISATAGIALAVLTAFVPTFAAYGLSQAFARGASAALALLIGVAAAEETPSGSRAYVVSILTMCGGLGSGMVVWFLPVTDIDVRAWRGLFLLAGLAVVPLLFMWRDLPETRRFRSQAASRETPNANFLGRRFVLLAITAFLLAAFAAPASTLQNTYLTSELGFSGARTALFKLVTNTPVGLGILVAGRLADRMGRRIIGSIGLVAGVVFTALEFNSSGWPIWLWGLLGTVIGAASIPALGVYFPELFSTSSRGRANGWLTIIGTAGSFVGLQFAGWSLDDNGFGQTFVMLAVAPLLVAALVLSSFPETARLSLEEINPDDKPI